MHPANISRRRILLSEFADRDEGYVSANSFQETDVDTTDDEIGEVYPDKPLYCQLLCLIDHLTRSQESTNRQKILIAAFNMRIILITLGELEDNSEDERAKTMAVRKEKQWLMCAMIIYQTLCYLQKLEQNGQTLTFEEGEKTYIFNPEDFKTCIWNCLREGKQISKDSMEINQDFFDMPWKSGN